MGVIIQLL